MAWVRRFLHAIAVSFGFAAIAVLSILPAAAEKRIALVIGIDRYANLPSLLKAGNDAEAVGDTLARLGFEVIRGRDLGRQAMIDKLAEFTAKLEAGDTAFFFFAGHGVAIGGVNYIIPGDAPAATAGSEARVRGASIAEGDVIAEIQAKGARVAVLVLDACRDNPFPRVGTRTLGNTRGLADAKPARGVFTIYSAGLGQTALDRLEPKDPERNSVFTRVFVEHLARPGVHLGELAVEVREKVAEVALKAKNERGEPEPHEQTPAYYDQTIGGRVFLAGLSAKPEPARPQPETRVQPLAADEVFWLTIKDSRVAVLFEEFIKNFPASPHAVEGAARLKELKESQSAAVVRQSQPSLPDPEILPKPAVGILPNVSGGYPLSPERERSLKPKDSFKECDACPEMVVVPAGSFTMGSPANESNRNDDEGPQRAVRFSEQFAVGKFSVTFEEWDACVADGGCNGYRPADQGWGRGKRPVINVSWNDSQVYLQWLSRRTGKAYRLLSEAEREYVTRAGSMTPFWWGTSTSPQQANYDDGNRAGRSKTVPVDTFQPNAFGFHHVHGNVWEWVEDCYHSSYRDGPTDGSARTSGNCTNRVLRGGSWSNVSSGLRAALREKSTTGNRNYVIGFRVARTLQPANIVPAVPQTAQDTLPKPAVGVFSDGSGVGPLSPERERSLKPKDSFKECDACPEMVVVPAGSFTMGSPSNEPNRNIDEGPQREVRFSGQFAVGKFSVTFDEWDACVADTGCNRYRPADQGWGRGKRPVINVSWRDAQAYLQWLSRKTGKSYRLLSEAEREYVVRAGSTTRFWWGTAISPQQANYSQSSWAKTAPVDSFQPNPFGLYQVHGNVWEWVEDCYNSYGGTPTDGSAWTSRNCNDRVLRGGSWNNLQHGLRSALRERMPVDSKNYSIGFRVARTLNTP